MKSVKKFVLKNEDGMYIGHALVILRKVENFPFAQKIANAFKKEANGIFDQRRIYFVSSFENLQDKIPYVRLFK